MADSEQKQILVSDAANVTVENLKENEPEKLNSLEEAQFIYTEAPVETQVGQDILQQALNEAENVIEGAGIEHETVTEVSNEGVENTVSEAQNLLNTLTGEAIPKVNDSEPITSNGDQELETEKETPKAQSPKPTENSASPLKTTKTLPLGSSQNPIHIIQQGNTYHSSQDLTKNQLQQIAQVLHKQQIVQALKNGGSSVVYNPDTNTRIVYRVVTPAEALEKNSNLLTRQSAISLLKNVGSSSTTTPVKRGRGRPRKDGSVSTPRPASRGRGRGRGRGRKPNSDEDLAVGREPIELTKEELENRKKHRPRTRSGRISKPPSFMVKEYKRIHPLDYNDDEDSVDEDSDVGYSDYEVSDDDSSGSAANAGEDDGDDKSSKNKSEIKDPEAPVKKSKHRGRPPLTEAERSNKRKMKLKEAMDGCSSSEVQDVVLQKVISEISVWDYILQKSSDNSKINMCEVLRQFGDIVTNLQKCLSENLRPIDESETDNKDSETIEIKEEKIANLFGVTEGKYKIINQATVEALGKETLKRSRDQSWDKTENESKRLKLDWSNTLDLASGVDVSISEVPNEEVEKQTEKKSVQSNVSIIDTDNTEVVSIAPVSKKEGEMVTNDKEPTSASKMKDKEVTSIGSSSTADNGPTSDEIFSAIENEVAAMDASDDPPVKPAEPEPEPEPEKSDTNVAEASNADDVQMIQIPDIAVIPVVGADDAAETTTAMDSANEQQTVTLLMENKDGTQEFVSTEEQPVVGVIEQPEDAINQESAITTESLLGYLGEQLSAEALQPGNIVIIQNPDGTTTTVALSGAEGKEIPMETVQALLAMDPSTTQQQIE